jgi:predicted aminopeptidase
MRRTGRIFGRVLGAFAVLLLVLILAYWDLVTYGVMQARGQLHIIWNARPVEEYLASPHFPDSLKTKLELVAQVRRYAVDSLGLKDTRNYKTLYDQKGEEIMWVVMASEPFQLRAREWSFPVVGSVPYKGFFDRSKAFALARELESEGWDVNVRNPGGWSTLGWFTDPILSKMLNRSEGDLANLIIHEMSHATIFVKDSVDFNENLATFIADRATEQFLIAYYGAESDEYLGYIREDHDYRLYAEHMLRGARKLDSLYQTIQNSALENKLRMKEAMIQTIVDALDTLSLHAEDPKPSHRFKDALPNNAYFLNFLRYQSKQDVFMDEYQRRFGGDLRAYVAYLADKYPFL